VSYLNQLRFTVERLNDERPNLIAN
jgi:hypothetical protein